MKIEINQTLEASFKDIAKLVEVISSDWILNNRYEKCYVGSYMKVPDPNKPLMCMICFTFQVWKDKEVGSGKKFLYTSYRGIDYSCANIGFKEISMDFSLL